MMSPEIRAFVFKLKVSPKKKRILLLKSHRRTISWMILVKIKDMMSPEKHTSIFERKSHLESVLRSSLTKLFCSFPGEERREIKKLKKTRIDLMKKIDRSEPLTLEFNFLTVAKKNHRQKGKSQGN